MPTITSTIRPNSTVSPSLQEISDNPKAASSTNLNPFPISCGLIFLQSCRTLGDEIVYDIGGFLGLCRSIEFNTAMGESIKRFSFH